MRIRSYLAILVITGLLGAYALEQVIAYHFTHVQALADKYNKSMLLAKDLERIENSAAQFLVSTDLVVASGNTYLIYGSKNMGYYLSNELTEISVDSYFKKFDTQIQRSIINIKKIDKYLDIIGDIPPNELETRLGHLLDEYDPISLTLSQDIQFLLEETNNLIIQDATELKQEKLFMNTVVWVGRGVFFLFVILLWSWANRKICKPINGLIVSSHKALAGGSFKAVKNAPTEIMELSNDFKFLTHTLSHQASHDPLTELNNRRAFERELNNIIEDNEHRYFLCFIDLDYFKTINDSCGHAAGDEILINVSRILKDNVRSYDTVARLGGDEFAILIKHCEEAKALKIANQIKADINQLTYQCETETFKLSASIGVAPKTPKSTTTDLLHAADVACSLAKSSGRNTVHLFDINDVDVSEQQQDMQSVHQINNAIANGSFVLYKQDIVPLQQQNTGKYFEILVRMLDSQGGIVSPASFFPIAERYKLSSKIDLWVINAVYDYFVEHSDQVKDIATISINLSGHSLTDNELESFIINKFTHSKLPADKFCFEITETAAITNTKRARLFMDNIKALGCRFALDDFGSGHSSYAYIKELPTDIIKIDGAFITNMVDNPLDYTTVKSICEIAKAAGQEIVAEFVEEENVVEALTQLGVDYAQGYYFDKPEPLI
ncbi:putative bifunctional diguanylate cyclase/phosphodiesterase [Pseudocolwellia sp. HL-MZ19]|uniref:putative bifunctional diguanylate cyclase/phosphodiesterase n=1 Tax=Pseudocolwellia sp. HL-MZ19 TaxID=3400846 RepID=UPI003CECBCF3